MKCLWNWWKYIEIFLYNILYLYISFFIFAFISLFTLNQHRSSHQIIRIWSSLCFETSYACSLLCCNRRKGERFKHEIKEIKKLCKGYHRFDGRLLLVSQTGTAKRLYLKDAKKEWFYFVWCRLKFTESLHCVSCMYRIVYFSYSYLAYQPILLVGLLVGLLNKF